MLNALKKHKIVVIVVLVDLFLTWLLVYSGIVLPYINPSTQEYLSSGTSFPRDYIEKLIWLLLHVPSSILIDTQIGGIQASNAFVFLPVVQTGIIAYLMKEKILHRCKKR